MGVKLWVANDRDAFCGVQFKKQFYGAGIVVEPRQSAPFYPLVLYHAGIVHIE